MLLRKHPFKVDPGSSAKTVQELASGKPRLPTEFHPTFSRRLQEIIMRAVAVNQEDRYQSALELAQDLKAFIKSRVKEYVDSMDESRVSGS